MTRHVRIYMDYFGYGEQDIICCEVCGKCGRADRSGFDIHHIIPRSQGGGNDIDNLCCLCRRCHNAAHGLEKTYLHKDVIHKIHEKVYKHD